MAAILTYMHQNGSFDHYIVHVMPTGLLLCHLTQAKTWKIKKWKISEIQNGHHFDVPSPKWLILLLGSVYQYSLASFNTRKA